MAGLEALDLAKTFRGRRVVDGVNLEIHHQEVVGLLGPNGAGKTTTFYLIVGLIRPDGGRVRLQGEDITGLPMYQRARRGLGYLPQEASVFRKLTVEENLLAILETLPGSQWERKQRARTLMEELKIDHLRDQRAFSLSGGERRRVEICRALATSPAFILMDEPFSGIDPIMVADLQQIIFQLKGKGIGVIITDHNVRETLQITDRAYIINDGKILETGTPSEIIQSVRARQVYLGENFSF
ncbi:MAG: LPS export ABC transporter ATP-binding protein [Candidatus Tectomicrobia bacterium]|uniref:LPS export ABC transporter ATP-binding protein n=1 Tax=Tectimicrobiota bacterium TaxID=2528274 RepID=A0A932CNF4_UNCTE|nr:LPS export ABC transporter ATP-binding protein [Candidatus Tectomicrobia bacterium]